MLECGLTQPHFCYNTAIDQKITLSDIDAQGQNTIAPRVATAALITEDMQNEARLDAANTQLRADVRNPWSTSPDETPLPIWSEDDRKIQVWNIIFDFIFIGYLRRSRVTRMKYAIIWLVIICGIVGVYYFSKIT